MPSQRYYTNGQESPLSNEISFTVPFPTNTALTFAPDSGTLTGPFSVSNGLLSQTLTTDLTNGGSAVYNFNILQAGDYWVTAMVIAPSLSENSFYVNIDADPTDPLMIWDIPVCTNLTAEAVSWRGNGNGDPASDQYSPKVFTLAVGPHQLIIRGREANTALDTISIVPAPPILSISLSPGSPVVLNVQGSPGQSYTLLGSQDLNTWSLVGTVQLDASGSGQFTDPNSTNQPMSVYRLQSGSASSY